MILSCTITTYNRPAMLARCLESVLPVADQVFVANGHISREVRQNIDRNPNDTTGEMLSAWREIFRAKKKHLEWWDRDAESFTDQANFLARKCPVNEWFFWICDDEGLIGDPSGIREWLESESGDFGTILNRGRTNPDTGYPLLYSRFIRRRDDTEFFPVHWQLIHRHQHIDLYNKKLSARVYDRAEIWDLEEYPSSNLPTLEEAKNWKPHSTQ